jgi:hypothetical protein
MKNKTRSTLPKTIAAAFKSGDKSSAMDLAIYQRPTSSLTELARRLFWLRKVKNYKNEALRDVVSKAIMPARESIGELTDPPPKLQMDIWFKLLWEIKHKRT